MKHDFADQAWLKESEAVVIDLDKFEKRMNTAIAIIVVIGWIFLAIHVAARLSE